MITKIIGKKSFVWDPKAFDYRGYWFTLGKRGKMGRAASRKEFRELGTPYEDEMMDEDPVKKKLSYEDADRINQSSFTGTISDRINDGGGVFSSIGKTVSEKTSAKLVGLKKKVDPLNIISMLTGGSKLGLALTGRLLGRDPEDVQYFGKKDPLTSQGSVNQQTLQSGDSIVNVATKIYKLIQRSHIHDKLYYDVHKKDELEIETLKDIRNKELIEALLGFGKFKSGKIEKIPRKKKEKDIDKTKIETATISPLKIAGLGIGALLVVEEVGKPLFKVAEKIAGTGEKTAKITKSAEETAKVVKTKPKINPPRVHRKGKGKTSGPARRVSPRVPPNITGSDKSVMSMIINHEGKVNKPYTDTTGNWTVGVGHYIGPNLPSDMDRTFSEKEINDLFLEDYAKHKDAAMQIPGYAKLNDKGKAALIDMTFNMGPAWYRKWPILTKELESGDIEGATQNLENSLWYRQVGNRADDDIALLRSSNDMGEKISSMSKDNNDMKNTLGDASSSSPSIMNNVTNIIATNYTKKVRMNTETNDLNHYTRVA